MAEPVENGPSNYNNTAEHVWERPWTLDEMRNNCSNWSLAADSGLYLYLQDFSQWMLSKTQEIEKQLDGLIRDTKATDSCLHTVFNDFLMLSNIQFIENRVYDEEVEESVPKPEAQEKRPEQEKTKEQKESELIPKVQEAVNYGLKVLESAFEQLDVKVGNSDSEDEEAADRVEPILEPKDLYVDRPLPYLIGSQAFMEQDDVGLGDLSSDEMSIDSDRDIESEEGKDEEDSDEEFEREEEDQASLKKKLSVVSYNNDEEENEDSDLFGESDKDEDDIREDDVGPTSFADELAARIKGDTPSKPDADRASLASGLSVSKKKSKGKKLPKTQVEDDDEMFKPPEMDEDEFSPFGGKKGLFSGGTNLFDDDEGDLFSEAPKKEKTEKEQTVYETTERAKTKKIPAGAVSIFPDNSLFGSQNGPASLESKENGTAVKPKVQAASERAALGGGLFDDNDDFFSGTTPKKSSTAAQEKPKPKKTADLFGGDENDDEDGDIFNASSRSAAAAAQPSKKAVGMENAVHASEKKSVPSPEVVKPFSVSKTAEKAQSTGLFSDDEDSQIFPAMPKSQSKPEGQTQIKQSKSAHSIFDDDDEEDLFSSVPKSESSRIKPAAVQPKKTLSSSLFSDDEDQWISSQPSTVKPEVKSGGMKTSTSAPSRLPGAKAPQKNSLFNDEDEDDLFAATQESSQKKPQRIALLFEDEDDAEKGSLFGFKPPADKGNPEVKVPAASSQAPSLFGSEEKQEVTSAPVQKKVTEEKPSGKETEPTTTSPNESNLNKKKPAGAVSLFGGINVLGDAAKTTKNQDPLDDSDDLNWNKEAPPPIDSKKPKAKKNTFSLFDDDEDKEEPDNIAPVSISAKPTEKTTLKSQEQKTHTKSTGVFQDEELLFSQTQLRDNDPEVDLFSTSAKPSAPQPSSVKPSTAPALFAEDDDDDLFSSAKPKAPPKVPVKPSKPKNDVAEKVLSTAQSPENEKPASTVKPKETTSRIGKLQATLSINPASLMPGAGPRIPGAVSVIPGLAHAPSIGAAGSIEPQTALGEGVSFDTPAQASTLQSANKDRVKGSMRRRPQTRAARVLAAQRSEDAYSGSQEENSNQAGSGASFNPPSSSVRPSALTLPISTGNTSAPALTPSDETVRPKIPPPAQEDLFSSKDLFAPVSAPKHTPSPQPKTTPSDTISNSASKEKESAPPILDDDEDLFATVKPKSVKKASAMPFLNDDDNDDIFGSEKKKDSKTLGISSKSDIFQDEKETQSKVVKSKEASLDVSLFDDDVDIFADLTSTTKPKEKKVKKKVETKSIFDDDMDDIFSSGITKPVVASSLKKPKKPTQESSSAEESGISIFDDPLNVFGGN
ncbi:WASH complex subunit 2 isoform X2 [Trichomycterus rosablanca]|uniref:WASH complex subunit 2 isoform X2 n=1 Tax=Trichomycterus rosablanca TaxID=2290929 RepID=UPI002F34F2D1